MSARDSRRRWLSCAAGLILVLCVVRAFGDSCDQQCRERQNFYDCNSGQGLYYAQPDCFNQ
jgi:hypothetical protein